MNRNLEVFTKIYKPYKIDRNNSVYILNTMDGNYVIKLNPKIDYKKLYSYLRSRSFDYVPKLLPDSRDDMVVMEYVEDTMIDKNQKILDLINLVSLLHSKTFYYKEISSNKYDSLYNDLKDNILFIDGYYDGLFMEYVRREISSPSEYLFLRNYSLIYNACKYCLDMVDSWYLKVQNSNKQRVVLVHNNLKLEHMIKNSDEYLISWDQYTFDSPILDLVNLYKNEWENVAFTNVIDTYNSGFELLDEEKLLFNILISMPYKVDLDKSEYERCREFRRLINYLSKSSSIVIDT
jgi:hypothetical protein